MVDKKNHCDNCDGKSYPSTKNGFGFNVLPFAPNIKVDRTLNPDGGQSIKLDAPDIGAGVTLTAPGEIKGPGADPSSNFSLRANGGPWTTEGNYNPADGSWSLRQGLSPSPGTNFNLKESHTPTGNSYEIRASQQLWQGISAFGSRSDSGNSAGLDSSGSNGNLHWNVHIGTTADGQLTGQGSIIIPLQ